MSNGVLLRHLSERYEINQHTAVGSRLPTVRVKSLTDRRCHRSVLCQEIQRADGHALWKRLILFVEMVKESTARPQRSDQAEPENDSSRTVTIGARINVVVRTGPESREIHRVVCFGGSFGSSPLRQHFGLRSAERFERVEVWRPVTRTTHTIRDLAPNRFYELEEGNDSPRVVEAKFFSFPGMANPQPKAVGAF